MDLGKYYVGVETDNGMERREVTNIDFHNNQFTVVSSNPGQPDELLAADNAIPLDKRGRKRLSYTFDLAGGDNIYKKSLPNAIESLDIIIEAYENKTADISTHTYNKAKRVRVDILADVLAVVEMNSVDIIRHISPEKVAELTDIKDHEKQALRQQLHQEIQTKVEQEYASKFDRALRILEQQQQLNNSRIQSKSNRFSPVSALIAVIRTILK